jgi:hypothetical protein
VLLQTMRDTVGNSDLSRGVQESEARKVSPALRGEYKRVGAPNELSNEDCESSAYDSCHSRGSFRILLRSAAGAGVYEPSGLQPALAHKLTTDATETVSTPFQFHLCRSTSGSQHRRRKALREKPSAPPLR